MAGVTLLYIDPGLGALIWQLVLSGVVGALFVFDRLRKGLRDARSRVSALFRGRSDGDDPGVG